MISVITPVLNAAHTLERTLLSLSQQKAVFEHIIQDGGSIDETEPIVRKHTPNYALRYFREPDTGIYDAVARGMEKSTGDILAWLGADDYYLPWTLSTVEAIFRRYPEVNWIGGLPAFGYKDGTVVKINPLAPVYLQSAIQRGWQRAGCMGFLQQEAMFWRKQLWLDVDAPSIVRRYKLAGDYHLWKAFASRTPLHSVSTVLAVFSVSEQQSSVRLRDRYFQEVGATHANMDAAWWGKLLSRGISIALNGRVLRPETTL